MPTQETKILDNIIASRRALLMGGGAALAALGFTKPAAAANTVASYTDFDILNFALNLEYLEANFYYLAAFGTTIDVSNTASLAAGAPVLAINGVLGSNTTANGNATAGIVANTGFSTAAASTYKVPFTSPIIAGYAVETAVEEGKHVAFLRSALNATTALAVAQPALNLTPANFLAVATAAKVPTSYNFNPYANDAFFLLGAYIFEDVGVSAYHGAAPLITGKTTYLPAAVGIHAVEAYHAGLVRTSIVLNDTGTGITATLPAGTLTAVTGLISTFRAVAAAAVAPPTANAEDPTPDDYGVASQSVTLNTATAVTATHIVDCTPQSFAAPATGFARSTTQVLNIVTGQGAATAGAIAKGGFFPNGLNGLFI
jgi:hypothetical protein